MKLIETGRTLGKTLKNAGRLKTIISVFARHGFENTLERLQLGRFILEKISPNRDELEKFTVAQRIRISFEELGPTFVKLGQLLATRPDLVPASWTQEFSILHASVQQLPFSTIEQVLIEEFGDSLYKNFQSFDPEPLGSASIAQVHKAKLLDGTEVVIKVQRPGIVSLINDDLSVLYFIAELLEKYIEEVRPFNPLGIIDEYFKTLDLETNFLIEANNIRRFDQNFKDDELIVIPKVYLELSTERVLVMEALNGIPLSSEHSLKQKNINPEQIVKTGMKCYLQMVFHHGLFHGDLHAGNFLILQENKIGLIDFGVVGRLNRKSQSAIANMLIALANEDYDRLAHEYCDLAPFNEGTDIDQFARELRDIIAPYYGLTMKNVNLGKILMNSASVASRNSVSLPTELMLFFKSIVIIEGLARRIIKDFDFLSYSLEFATELAKTHYDKEKIALEAFDLIRDSKSLLYTFPRQLKQLLRKLNSPQFAVKVEILEIDNIPKAINNFGIMMYWGLIISSLIVSSSIMLGQPSVNQIAGIPTASFVGYSFAILFGVWAYWKKR
jgi:ubiquinone biosynthesis protein